jgi:Uma2 family endonuclease
MGTSAYQMMDPDFITVEEYLSGEELAEERHVYINGQVFAMAGATEQHEIVSGNLFAAMLAHLRGKGCKVFKGDMKVRLHLNQKDLFYYPDIMVVCDPSDREPAYKERPRIIVEVMTEYKSDHVEKLFAYQQIPTLEEYLVISQDPKHPEVWLYRRDANWGLVARTGDGMLRLDSIGFSHPVMDLYVMD